MRTQRRPLALAATLATAFVGVGLVAGATPAAAAQDTNSAVTDCSTNSITPGGMLDVGLLQSCLNQLQTSLNFEPLIQIVEEVTVAEEPAAPEEPVAAPSTFDALDPMFGIEEPEAPVEEAAPATDGMEGDFAALRECESGGNYGINTGNGYYGAYQFALPTWHGLGYGGYPHEASPAVQDQAARELQALYGWGQWPGCSWYLGLS